MPYGIVDTAQNNMTRPYGGINPFAPAGITDMTRQGWATGLQGQGMQMPGAQAYAGNMEAQAGQSANAYNNWMSGGQFSGNPNMTSATNVAGGAYNQPGFSRGMSLAGQAPNRGGFGQAAGMIGNTMSNYGGGWSGGMADTINQTGASFNPFNPMVGQMAGAANQQLGRDFRQNVMPELNRAAGAAGPGAYGGTRAGVAQGVREQGLADAMQRQTTDLYGGAYEAGLGRYVQDRGQTLGATNAAMQTGGQLGMQGAQQRANIANMKGGLMNQSAGIMGNIANMQGGLQNQSAGVIGDLGKYSLGQRNNMFQFGHGQMLPQGVQNQYQASQAPGQVLQGMGNAMGGIGGMQQGSNQQNIDWMNQRYNAQQGYPDRRLANYGNAANPYLRPGNVPEQQAGQRVPSDPWGAAVGGGMAGYGAYDAWNRGQQPGNYTTGGQTYTPDQYRTWM